MDLMAVPLWGASLLKQGEEVRPLHIAHMLSETLAAVPSQDNA